MSSQELLSLGQIPTIKLDAWKTINPDGKDAVVFCVLCLTLLLPPTALFFLHRVLVARDIGPLVAPDGWEAHRPQLTAEVSKCFFPPAFFADVEQVLAFTGLQHDTALTESCKACLAKLDKTYLLDFLLLFNIQQQNGRTFNRRHAPGSLVQALVDYLDNPGEHYMEVHKMITSKERPVRSNRNTATLNEDNLDAMASAGGAGGPPDSPSEEEEEEWGLPEASSSSKKRRHNTAEPGGAKNDNGVGTKEKSSRHQSSSSPSASSPANPRRRGATAAAAKSGAVPLRQNPPRTPTLSHPINYNINQNFSALASALSHTKTTYVRGGAAAVGGAAGGASMTGNSNGAVAAGKPKRAKAEEKVAADLWVACDLCEKWRLLPPGTYASEDDIPAQWQCDMYPTARYNNCSIPEETAATAPDEELVVLPPKKPRVTTFSDPVSIDMLQMEARLADEARAAAEAAAVEALEADGDAFEEEEDDAAAAAAAAAAALGGGGGGANANANDGASSLLVSAAAEAMEDGDSQPAVRFVLAEVVAQKPEKPSALTAADVPDFFRGKVLVVRNKTPLGELLLTEKETVLDVRRKIEKEWPRESREPVVLLKRGEIPILETQNHKLAHWFLADPSDFLEVK